MSKPNLPKLPAEAIKFAKSMGLDLNGLEPEAEDIWKMLDDMSTRDPLQYEAFVSQQFENAKEGGDKSTKVDDEKRSFRPVAGYCVESTSLSGDGLKIRDVGTSSGKKFYINICSSVVIEEPTDKAGKVIKGDRTVADGLNIPLIVGPVRPADATSAEKDKELYVDVVLHPRVIELAGKEKYFKAQIVDLALEWVIQETKVDCDRKWSHVTDSTYKGGRGDKRDTPVLFFVDATGAPVGATPFAETTASTTASAVPAPFSSTSSLLSQIHKDKQGHSDFATEKVDIFATSNTKNNQNSTTTKIKQEISAQKEPPMPKKTLIQEIGAPSPKSPFEEDPVKQQPPAPTAPTTAAADTKKKDGFGAGFLNAKPTASNNSATGPKPKLTTVDKSLLTSPTPAPAPTAAPAVPAPLPKHTTLQEFLRPTAPNGNIDTAPTPASAPAAREPTKMECVGMERLLSSFDDAFTATSASDANFMDIETTNSMIADLAKVLSGGNSSLLDPAHASNAAAAGSDKASVSSSGGTRGGGSNIEDLLEISNEAPSVVTITAKTEREAGSPFAVLVLSIAGLSSSLDTSTMELLVSPSEVVVRVDKQHLAGTEPTLSHKQRASFGVKYTNAGANKHVLKEGSAAAGFKKKKGVLTVKIQYL